MSETTDLERYLVDLVNGTRAAAGRAPLTIDQDLSEAADAHTAWMLSADRFSHTGQNGSTVGQRIDAAGYDGRAWAENIAYRNRGEALDRADVEGLHQQLVNSSGHHANLINTRYTEIGVGLAEGDFNGRTVAMLTENFGQPLL